MLAGKLKKKKIQQKYFLFRSDFRFNIFLLFLDSLEDLQTVGKSHGQSERLPYSLGNVLDSLEDFRTV